MPLLHITKTTYQFDPKHIKSHDRHLTVNEADSSINFNIENNSLTTSETSLAGGVTALPTSASQ